MMCVDVCVIIIWFAFNSLLTWPLAQVSSPQLPCKDDLNKELIFEFRDIISISGKIDKSNVKDAKGRFKCIFVEPSNVNNN